jgi:hypothetical protein
VNGDAAAQGTPDYAALIAAPDRSAADRATDARNGEQVVVFERARPWVPHTLCKPWCSARPNFTSVPIPMSKSRKLSNPSAAKAASVPPPSATSPVFSEAARLRT